MIEEKGYTGYKEKTEMKIVGNTLNDDILIANTMIDKQADKALYTALLIVLVIMFFNFLM